MSDEAKKMEAIFLYSNLLVAAVWLAVKNDRPILQFTRKGDKLEVLGSDAYILVRGEIDATFTDWEDGVAVKLTDLCATAALRQAFKCVDAEQLPLSLVVEDGSATFYVSDYSIRANVLFTQVSTNPLAIESIEELITQEPEGKSYMASKNLRTVAKLTQMISYGQSGWHIEPYGKNKPLVLRLDPEWSQGNIVIMAATKRED